MSPGAARQNDPVQGVDNHLVLVPSPGGLTPTPLPHQFSGTLVEGLSSDVLVDGLPIATVGSVARNVPPHLPTSPGTAFSKPPSNQGMVQAGSAQVLVNGRQAARVGDPVRTCNEPVDAPTCSITSGSSDVIIG
jgi:uncharacterized Zn-binding protein involved in type VI secretion